MKKFCLILGACLLLANSGWALGSKSVKQPEVGGGIALPYADPQPSHYTLIVAETVFDTAAAAVTAAPATLLQASGVTANVTGSAAIPEAVSDTENAVTTAALEQADAAEPAAVSETAEPPSMFGALIVQDSQGIEYQPEVYSDIGTDDSQEGWASNNVRIFSYVIPASRQLSLLYDGQLGRQTQEFELNGSRTIQIKVSRNIVDVERVATRYESREVTRIITENIVSTADAAADAPELAEAEEENTAVALAGDEEDAEDYADDDSGWNVDEEEYLAADGSAEDEYEYVDVDDDEDEEGVEYEYVEVDEDEEDAAYAAAEDEEDEELEYADADLNGEVSAAAELTLAAAIVTREVTVTEDVPVTESYIAQETTENIEFTLAAAEDLGGQYGLPLIEQAYYTLTIAEALYDDTPGRRAHAFGRLVVTGKDDKMFTSRTSSWTDNSRGGAFNNNARLRRYLIPVNTTLQFNYRSGNTALSMIDCDELYPNPLLNYELDGTLGSLKVTKLEMNNSYAIHIRAGWGSVDAGLPLRLVNTAQ